MSKKLVRGVLLITLSGFSISVFSAPPLPAVPSADVLFPQVKPPQSRLTLEMLPKAREQTIAQLMATPVKLPGKIAKQTIYIAHVFFIGNTVISSKKLSRIAGIENKITTLGELDAALDRVTKYYHKKGYILAHAYLPVQTVREGHVTFKIIEGNISAVVLNNNSQVLTSKIRAILDSYFKIGKPLSSAASNRAIMILRAMPGIGEVTPSLYTGSLPGTAVVKVTVSPGADVTGNIGANNYLTRFAGQYQAYGAVNINNITHHGDEIGLQGGVSKNDLLDNARIFWEIPITHSGFRSGFSLTQADYEVGDSLSSLRAHGQSNAATWYGRYPLYLSPLIQTNFEYSLDHRWLEDDTDSTGTNVPKKIDALILTLSGNAADNLFRTDAVNTWSIANTVGTLSIRDASQLTIDGTTAKTNGQYDKMVFLLSRQQSLTDQWSLYLSGNGQWSDKNLDASEQFVLGGPTAVRAYPTGEAGGDEGVYGTLELRDQLRHWLQLTCFYDGGKVWFNKNPYIVQSNTRVIAGPGVGANITYKKFTLNTALAVRNTGPALADYDARPRWWLQLQYSF